MIRRCASWTILCTVMAVAPAANAGEAPKIAWKVEKGAALAFNVKRQSATQGQSPRGEFKVNTSSEIQYRVEVADRKDNGDLVLKVTYASVKAKSEGREGAWEFDSAKKEGKDDVTAYLQDATAKTIEVKLAGGKIADIAGFPEIQRGGEGDRGNFRRFQGLRVAGRNALQNDLELILSTAVLGQALEKDKVYIRSREARGAGEEGARQRGRGMFDRGEARAAYRYEGDEKVGDAAAAKFSFASAPPEKTEEGGARQELNTKAKGSALVSQKDGLLLKLELSSEGESSFERDGQTSKFSRQSKVEIAREPAKKEAEKKPPAVSL
ncbi:MAG: hypothetical protein HY717_20470 [Planctomycetes bacterium]|nr:hypothetical protein [Planctomycetota bacterium]